MEPWNEMEWNRNEFGNESFKWLTYKNDILRRIQNFSIMINYESNSIL